MSKIAVVNSDIVVSVGRYSRVLIAFPTNVNANHALAWCHAHKFNVVQSVKALRDRCIEKGLKKIGRKFPKSFGSLTGTRAFKAETKDLTLKKQENVMDGTAGFLIFIIVIVVCLGLVVGIAKIMSP